MTASGSAGKPAEPLKALGAFAAALALYVAGLLSPLAPSIGCPPPLSLFLFTILPVLVPVLVARRLRSHLARLVLYVEAVALGASSVLLLRALHCMR